MQPDHDMSAELLEQAQCAKASGQNLYVFGGASKASPAPPPGSLPLCTAGHSGVIDYHPSELVITARAGTPIAQLSELLQANGQYLPFEPRQFNGRATLGGTVAEGLSGPRRPWSGSVRDYVLGCQLISGEAKLLRFGGQVMKNVAGYDVSRLMAGSRGWLGVLTEISLKVLPAPRAVTTQCLQYTPAESIAAYFKWYRQGLPVTGVMHDGTSLFVRLEGNENGVRQAAQTIGGDDAISSEAGGSSKASRLASGQFSLQVDDNATAITAETADIWSALREHTLPFFNDPRVLWRLSVPVGTRFNNLPGNALMDWAGAQWWLKSDADPAVILAIARESGGHACAYRDGQRLPGGSSPEPGLQQLAARIKAQLDPHSLFNPGFNLAGN
jgi:glycolate oxidase FAD binding subunit